GVSWCRRRGAAEVARCVEFSTGFKVTINTNTTEVTLPGVPDPLPAGPYLKVEAGTDAAPATMTIAGQTLSGKFAFEQYTVAGTGNGAPIKHGRPAATDITLYLRPRTPTTLPKIVSITPRHGFFLFPGAGLTG